MGNFYLSVCLALHGWGKVPCLSVKSDFCSFLIMERDIWDGETKSCLCLGPVDPAVPPEESRVRCEGEQVPGGYVRDCPWALPRLPPTAPSGKGKNNSYLHFKLSLIIPPIL